MKLLTEFASSISPNDYIVGIVIVTAITAFTVGFILALLIVRGKNDDDLRENH